MQSLAAVLFSVIKVWMLREFEAVLYLLTKNIFIKICLKGCSKNEESVNCFS